jgi:hypothetical protein
VEIACPPTCGYLAVATSHPPAVVRRQQEHDLVLLMPILDGLSDSQGQLLSLVFSALARHGAGGFPAPRDGDVVDGLSALLATYETAGRGVIYEHRPETLPGQRIVTELGGLFSEVAQKGGRPVERDAALVLSRVKQLAESVRKASPGSDTAFLALVRRVARSAGPEDARERAERPSIIVP